MVDVYIIDNYTNDIYIYLCIYVYNSIMYVFIETHHFQSHLFRPMSQEELLQRLQMVAGQAWGVRGKWNNDLTVLPHYNHS